MKEYATLVQAVDSFRTRLDVPAVHIEKVAYVLGHLDALPTERRKAALNPTSNNSEEGAAHHVAKRKAYNKPREDDQSAAGVEGSSKQNPSMSKRERNSSPEMESDPKAQDTAVSDPNGQKVLQGGKRARTRRY